MVTAEFDGWPLDRVLEWRAREHPDHFFFSCGDDSMTYREADRRVERVAAGLAHIGVEQGERVAIISPNRPEMFELYFACSRIGAVQVPLNAFLKGEFLRYQLADSEATTLIADAAGCRAALPLLDEVPELRRLVPMDPLDPGSAVPERVAVTQYEDMRGCAAAAPRRDIAADDLMSIVYTSGTTGLPKGCMLPHGYYMRVARFGVEWLGFTDADVYFSGMPLFHASTRMTGLGAVLLVGAGMVLEPEFRASSFMSRAAQLGATVVGGVGAMGVALLNQPVADIDQRHRLRLATIVPFSVDQQSQFKERFGVADLTTELYGQTECFPVVFDPLEGARNRASDGLPAPDLEVRIVDGEDREVGAGQVGEIIVRPHHRHAMFKGYWRKPEATLEAFRNLWYHTGDYGRADEDGFVSFVDRKKDALRRRGENVSSAELEAAISVHPKIAEAAAHAVESDLTEDDIKACIVLNGGSMVSPEEIFEFFKDSLPYYAIPRYVEVVPELPKNAVSRVMKHQLRERGVTDDTWDLESLGLTVARAARR